MDFQLSADHEKLIEAVRTFGRHYFTPESVAQWQRDGGLPDEVVRDFVNLDFNGFSVIHRRNHTDYDLFAQVLVLEELARVAGATLPFSNDFLNLQIMEAFAATDQFAFVREGYQTHGRLAFALAISEPEAGSDTMNMHTETHTVGGTCLLNGRKTFVNNGEYAPYILVAAQDKDAQEVIANQAGESAQFEGTLNTKPYPPLSLWLVPHDVPGISVYPIMKIGQSILPFSDVHFDNVILEESYRLHGTQSGFPQLFRFFELGRLFSCATALGLAQAAMEDAVAYAAKRSAFGVRIADFQQIEQMLTDMEIKLENMRNSVYKNACILEGGVQNRLGIACMKRYVPAAATEVASDALQILGGRGYTRNERVSSIWQDCRGFQIAEGTDQIMVYIAAPLIMKKYQE